MPHGVDDVLGVDLNVVAQGGVGLVIDVGAKAVEAGICHGRRGTGGWIGQGTGAELLLQLVLAVSAEDPPAILENGTTCVGGRVIGADEGRSGVKHLLEPPVRGLV